MTTSLYTLHFNYIDALYWAIPLILALAFFSASQAHATAARQDGKKANLKVLLSLRLCSLLMALVFVVGFGGNLLQFQSIQQKYAAGNFQSVSGPVENFQPLSLMGLGQESFRIDDTDFSYSDFILTHGYHDSGKDSLITGNGQMLQIGYLDTGSERIIVEITEIHTNEQEL